VSVDTTSQCVSPPLDWVEQEQEVTGRDFKVLIWMGIWWIGVLARGAAMEPSDLGFRSEMAARKERDQKAVIWVKSD
jgi:hypothetical protein